MKLITATDQRITKGTYGEALSECDRLNMERHQGRTDWRLPTVSEVLAAREVGEEWNGRLFWCSDAAPSVLCAWFVSFNLGYAIYNDKQNSYSVRCVSDGPR